MTPLLLITCFFLLISSGEGEWLQVDVEAVVGNAALLPCTVNELRCGAAHNIQWYRGHTDTRVFLYSQLAGVEIADNMLAGRGSFHYDTASSITSLRIAPILPDDEAVYKCEVTYLEVRDFCTVIQFVNLTTTARPEAISIQLENGSLVASGALIGPLAPGHSLALRCETYGAKPAAQLTWWKNTVNIGGENIVVTQRDGTSLSTNILHYQLEREDLDATFECQAVNRGVQTPLRTSIVLDMLVPPLSVKVTGLADAVTEGDHVTLVCHVTGAKPAANATWYYNGKLVQGAISERLIKQSDGTTQTISKYIWTAKRAHNGKNIYCSAENSVSVQLKQSHVSDAVWPNVQYAPIVRVLPSTITVNESMDVLILCALDSNPSNLTDLEWYKNGRRLNTSFSGDPHKHDTAHDLKRHQHFASSSVPLGRTYSGGNAEQPSLLISKSSPKDTGVYRCRAKNSIGWSLPAASATVIVLRAAEVVVSLRPTVVVESEKQDVTLSCNSVLSSSMLTNLNSSEHDTGAHFDDIGPDVLATFEKSYKLRRIKWYRNGVFFRETIDCRHNDAEGGFKRSPSGQCDEKYSELTLSAVNRSLHGSYSCQGQNQGGWGLSSASVQLTVHYPPGRAKIHHDPLVVTKGSSLVLHCSLDQEGFPPNYKFTWMRGAHVVTGVTTAEWHVADVTSHYGTNYSCLAKNSAGAGQEGTLPIQVLAPPKFIQSLPSNISVTVNNTNVSLTCRVECAPPCTITWQHNGKMIDDGPRYSIYSRRRSIDRDNNIVASSESTLVWLSRPLNYDESIGAADDTSNVATSTISESVGWRELSQLKCVASGNAVGAPVESATLLMPQYIPQSVVITPSQLEIVEGADSVLLTCSSQARPLAKYVWTKDGHMMAEGAELLLRPKPGGIRHQHAGVYVCRAMNIHGVSSASAEIIVHHAPTCHVRQVEFNGLQQLLCEALSSDDQLQFHWYYSDDSAAMAAHFAMSSPISSADYTTASTALPLEDHNNVIRFVRASSNSSRLVVPSGGDIRHSKVQCVAANSVGRSAPCFLDSTATGKGWLAVLADGTHANLAALCVVLIVFLAALFLFAYLCFCRQRCNKNIGRNSRKQTESFYECYHRAALSRPSLLPVPLSSPDIVLSSDDIDSGYKQIGVQNYQFPMCDDVHYENFTSQGTHLCQNKTLSIKYTAPTNWKFRDGERTPTLTRAESCDPGFRHRAARYNVMTAESQRNLQSYSPVLCNSHFQVPAALLPDSHQPENTLVGTCRFTEHTNHNSSIPNYYSASTASTKRDVDKCYDNDTMSRERYRSSHYSTVQLPEICSEINV